jgi:hypothetical protein
MKKLPPGLTQAVIVSQPAFHSGTSTAAFDLDFDSGGPDPSEGLGFNWVLKSGVVRIYRYYIGEDLDWRIEMTDRLLNFIGPSPRGGRLFNPQVRQHLDSVEDVP